MPATTWTPTSCKVCCMLGERNPRSLWCAMTRVCGSKRLRTCSSEAPFWPSSTRLRVWAITRRMSGRTCCACSSPLVSQVLPSPAQCRRNLLGLLYHLFSGLNRLRVPLTLLLDLRLRLAPEQSLNNQKRLACAEKGLESHRRQVEKGGENGQKGGRCSSGIHLL